MHDCGVIGLSVYIVVFDLHSRYESYSSFFSLLEEYDHVKVFENAWYIDSALEAREIYGRLSQGLKGSDRIMIHTVGKDFSGYIPGKANGWIYAHLETTSHRSVRSLKKHVTKSEASLLRESNFKPKGRF